MEFKTKSEHIAVGILFIIIVTYVPMNSYSLGAINILSLFYFGRVISSIQGRFLSPFLIIATCLYIFHAGHLWLALINPNADSFLLSFEWYRSSSIHSILETYSRITILLIVFMLTGVAYLNPMKCSLTTSPKEWYATKFFWFLFIILYIIAMFFEFTRAHSVSSLGYGAGYKYGNAYIQYLAILVDILLLLFLYVYKNKKNIFKKLLFLLLFRAIFIIFFVGNRGASVIYMIVTIFILGTYSYMATDQQKLRRIAVASLLFIVVALPFISATRGEREKVGINEFVSMNNPIESFLEEFGGTVYNVFLTEELISVNGPANGIQILGTSLSIVPGSTELFGDIIERNISIGSQLNTHFNRQGLGGSLISQLIFNFGNSIFLYIAMFFVALLVVWSSNQLMSCNSNIYKTLFLLCLFTGLLTFVRGEWYDVVTRIKMCVYLLIILYFCKQNLLIEKLND